MARHQQKPIDVKLRVKPVFGALIHSDAKEGPCRTGSPQDLNPDAERERSKESFDDIKENLVEVLSGDAEILDPAYIEYGESLVIPDSRLKTLEPELQQVDLFLLLSRVPGIERYDKPIAMVGKGVTNVDVAAYLRSKGLEGYAPLDFDELNELISLLRVRKAIKETRILVVSDEEIVPWGVVSSVWNLEDLKNRYGIDSKRVSFKTFYDQMDRVDQKVAETLASQLISHADKVHMSNDAVTKSVIPYMAAKALMDKYECNAFTIPCFELCVTKVPAERKFTPCLTHAMLKNEGYPAACEGDLSALLATMLLMYHSKKSTYMGNPSIGSKERNILTIQHDAVSLKMKGLDKPDLPYEIRHFTQGGWGAVLRYDFAKDKGQEVTLARFNPTATKLLLARGEIVAGVGFDGGGCGLGLHIKVPNVAELIHKQADFGHHMAIVYGDYTQRIKKLADLMKFEIVAQDK